MSNYGQFCPIARSVEILGERWTLLVVRELLLGSTRFNELQRGLSRMSPSLLTKRLQELEAAGILYKRKLNGQKGYEYQLTGPGRQLEPIVMGLADWGINYIESQFSDDELDLELLMFDMHRSLIPDNFPQGKTTLKFYFTDADQFKEWWFVVDGYGCDLCTKDPGYETDVYITTNIRQLTDLWMGNVSWREVMRTKKIKLGGQPALIKQIPDWIGTSRTTAFKRDHSALA